MLRNKKENTPPIAAEDSAQKRKASVFTDLLTKNRKVPMPSENLQNSKVYTVPEGNPRARKGSTFTDLLSRNKKTPIIPDNASSRSNSSFRKPSIIMEEVRWRLKPQLNAAVHALMNILCFLQSEDQTDVIKATPLETLKEDVDPEEPTLDRPLTSLEKLHIIVSYGIVRQDLRLGCFFFNLSQTVSSWASSHSVLPEQG